MMTQDSTAAQKQNFQEKRGERKGSDTMRQGTDGGPKLGRLQDSGFKLHIQALT